MSTEDQHVHRLRGAIGYADANHAQYVAVGVADLIHLLQDYDELVAVLRTVGTVFEDQQVKLSQHDYCARCTHERQSHYADGPHGCSIGQEGRGSVYCDCKGFQEPG